MGGIRGTVTPPPYGCGVRLLHTSDWHLGRLFHRASLLDEQERALARLVELVEDLGVEVVLIAGDLYDRAIPPADAVELFDRTLMQLQRLGARVVAISGNHDSAVRVGYADRLLEQLGVTVRGELARTGEPVVVAATDGGPPLHVYPIPYLDPLATAHHAGRHAPPGPAVEAEQLPFVEPQVDEPAGGRRRFTHHDAMAWAMGRVRASVDAAPGCRSVVVAHTFLTGGNPSESERDLTVGHVEQVRLDVFDGIDYVALGHLHRRQGFDGGRVAYSGTPLRYSFSEAGSTPSVRVVDLDVDGGLRIDDVALGVGRGLHTLTGTLDELLTDARHADVGDGWVRAVLTDRTLPLQAMARLQQRFPNAVELRHEPAGATASADDALAAGEVRAADPFDLTRRFLEEQRGVALDAEEHDVLAAALDAARAGSAS